MQTNTVNTLTNMTQVVEVLQANNAELVTFDHNFFNDNYLSQHYFDEFKEDWSDQSLWFNGRNSTDYIVFFATPELMTKPYYKVSHLRKMSKLDLYNLCDYYEILDYYHSDSFIKDCTKQGYIDELMKYVDNEKYYTKHFEETSIHGLDCDFNVTGYSQGDAFKVKLIGTEKQFRDNDRCNLVDSESLENLFYKSPMVLNIEIFVNGNIHTEISLTDYINMYDYYDRSDCINVIKQHYSDHTYYGALLEYCENELPCDLDYVN